MIENSHLRFTSFHFKNFSIENREIFSNYCNWIKSIKLYYDKPIGMDSKGIELETLLSKLPNLETLEIQKLPDSMKTQNIIKSENPIYSNKVKTMKLQQEFRAVEYSGSFLKDLFHLAPNLDSLSVEIECDYANQIQEETILHSLIINKSFTTITQLQLSFINSEMMNILSTGFQTSRLRKFSVKLLDRIDGESFELFLNCHKNSLEYLQFGLSRCIGLKVQMPRMPKLGFLAIQFFHSYCENQPSLGTMDYGNLFPDLLTLVINDQSMEDSRNLRKIPYIVTEIFPYQTESIPARSIRNLRLPQSLESSKLVLGITKMFPNITTLKMDAQHNVDIYSVIWSSPWAESLQNLHIELYSASRTNATKSSNLPINYKLDAILTGIDECTCAELVTISEISPELLNIKNLVCTSPSASISNMKSKKLK